MTSSDVLSMYEHIAGLSGDMAAAARQGDLEKLAGLQAQCAIHAAATATGVPPLTGEARQRKLALLKQIMANDRAVREVTEPWKLDDVVRAAAAH